MSTDGIPLLSGTPPDPYQGVEPSNCRRCNKEFNFLFSRPKRCNHCGFSYCSSCTDFQALMPRSNGYDSMPVCTVCMEMLTTTSSSRNRLKGMPLSKLRTYMKSYNISPGRAVEKDDLVDAIIRAKDTNGCLQPEYEEYYRKNSVPQWNGERKSRNIFSKFNPGNDTGSPTPQPQWQSRSVPPPPGPPPQQRQYAPPPGPPPPTFAHNTPHNSYPPYHGWQPHSPPHPQYPPPPQPPPHFQPQRQWNPPSHQSSSPPPPPNRNWNPPSHQSSPPPPPPNRNWNPPSHQSSPPPPPPPPPNRNSNLRHTTSHTNLRNQTNPQVRSQARQPPARPRSAAPTVTPTNPSSPPPPVPSLDELLQKTNGEIGRLSISTLKSILYDNRVNSSVGILEKQDLVQKVIQLVTDERFDREIKERQDREEAERMEWARLEREQEQERRRAEEQERESLREDLHRSHAEDGDGETVPKGGASDTPPNMPGRPQASTTGSPSFTGGTADGLCVVCQDEHANMAIIDCGHLALCKSCSELIMTTSRECPLCRTRIVTEQRLLRIFRS